jgi:hypothetical protein
MSKRAEIFRHQHDAILERMLLALEQIAEAERADRVILGNDGGADGIDGSHENSSTAREAPAY